MVRKKENIDWTNINDKISENFTVKEALFLPSIGVLHSPSESEKFNILKMAEKMEMIREFFHSQPVIVHCWTRPKSVNALGSGYHGFDYNDHVGGFSRSGHITGAAVDFHIKGFEGDLGCKTARVQLTCKIEDFNVRLEDKDGSWLHVDIKPVVYNRFFKP